MRLGSSLKSAMVWLVAGTLAGGCASIGGEAKPPEQAVVERAQARWDALLRRDWAAAYQYLVPAYRSIVSVDRYGNQFSGPVQWESAMAKSAQCEEKRCTVAVEVMVRVLLPGHRNNLLSSNFEEVWVLEDGKWFKFEAN